MKCPKCSYLGFETGDRCRNCGYDFSLLTANTFEMSSEPDITIRGEDFTDESMDMWLTDLNSDLPEPVIDLDFDPIEPRAADERLAMAPEAAPEAEVEELPAPPRLRSVEAPLPLFIPADDEDDTPLIVLPAAPRTPLAVRRTPEIPRLRSVSRLRAEPALDFCEEPDDDEGDAPKMDLDPTFDRGEAPASAAVDGSGSVTWRRLAAATIDHLILLTIDMTVVYFTLRIAGLAASEWRLIPPAPMAIFLGMMACAYFTAFTIVGGQTIGKMATGIRVISDDRRTVDGAMALRRTIAGALSYVTIGLAYLPGFIGGDRRTLHDRIARTRVVARPSA